MYNFRYHLITIVAIFAALALGLLLGVAITGSDLVRDASSNLAESLTDQFDELRAENEDLADQLELQRTLGAQLQADWQDERLDGRTIVVLTRADEAGVVLENELANLVESSGGIAISIKVDPSAGFGLGEESEAAALKALLPEVEGETYETTLAQALAEEWTTSTNGDAPLTRSMFEAKYPLTNQLIKANRITVSVDYQLLIDALKQEAAQAPQDTPTDTSAESPVDTLAGTPADLASPAEEEQEQAPELSKPSAASTQSTSFEFAQQLQLPYCANGVIDASFLSAPDGTQLRADEVSLQLAQAFTSLGTAGDLPSFLGMKSTESESSANNDDEQAPVEGTYFAVLLGGSDTTDLTLRLANENSLPCVVGTLDATGSYSVIALLSGAEKGSYGAGINSIQAFPSLPTDKLGTSPFIK
jgi:hypothetical protein